MERSVCEMQERGHCVPAQLSIIEPSQSGQGRGQVRLHRTSRCRTGCTSGWTVFFADGPARWSAAALVEHRVGLPVVPTAARQPLNLRDRPLSLNATGFTASVNRLLTCSYIRLCRSQAGSRKGSFCGQARRITREVQG